MTATLDRPPSGSPYLGPTEFELDVADLFCGLMMAKAVLAPEQRNEERMRAEHKVHQAAWEHALDVVG